MHMTVVHQKRIPSALPLLAALLPLVVAWGCGGKSKSVEAPLGGGNGTGLAVASNCRSKDDCPKAAIDFAANLAPGNVFIGFANEPVDWKISGVDGNTKNPDGMSSARRMAVLLDNVPEGSDFSPGKGEKLASSVTIDWTPSKSMKGKLDVIVRDAERCEKDHDKDYCNAYKPLDAYDKRFEGVAWEIRSREDVQNEADSGSTDPDGTVTVSDPNCGGAAAATTDGEIQGKVLGTFIQALQPGGLLKVGTTLFSGGLGGGGTTTGEPTKC
jgi:hypothetical protein